MPNTGLAVPFDVVTQSNDTRKNKGSKRVLQYSRFVETQLKLADQAD